MMDKKYLNSIKKNLLQYAEVRREVIKSSDDALYNAKRAIFAMHRDNMKEAEEKLLNSKKLLENLLKKYYKYREVEEEGSFKAGLEEYVEANLFYQFLTTGKIGKIADITIPERSYIGGLCDVPGELYRYAIKSATQKDMKKVKQCTNMAQEITGELIEFNLTSYLRNKFDQAKMAAQKIEKVVYELSLNESK
ncbi:MAG: hypothetical protein COY69_02750 [Candidatus Magasanikbacteria bacterium CG_4_10_14_0_8_um_filter_32_14]|uniref:Haloacid dehalogenase n=2 Tax=Candidatus Magasanikiibacteriota TaxID=1752731 RepID=A0A2M7R8Z1_9BACT|nr:MAG: hypothetical protein AUJ23_01980 [Candidatus Magasanikbacteria bacterium CG1_02_32_51]PIY93228.1 MAG: hypothetical protein COY69_02750 [Candidatus Magasanikbacteria bacterium CG_4_10_14_0_8_um_filter_32_14]